MKNFIHSFSNAWYATPLLPLFYLFSYGIGFAFLIKYMLISFHINPDSYIVLTYVISYVLSVIVVANMHSLIDFLEKPSH